MSARRRRASAASNDGKRELESQEHSGKRGNDKDEKPKHRSKPKAKAQRRKFWATKRFVLVLGAAIGAFIGATYFVADDKQVANFTDNTLQWLMSHRDKLPSSLLSDVESLTTEPDNLSDSFAVGLNMAKEGYSAKYPVVLVPGVISTSLESWSLNGTEECPSKPHYRKRLWGGWYMIRTMLMEKSCWLQHIMLDKETGLDPPNFKIRAAQGLEAADFFITGYWIWNKIIENLSALSYDTTNLFLAAYDWRLAYADLETRDGWLTRLKTMVENNYELSGQKSVLYGHSMGSQVIFYFMKWVEADGYGNGGRGWVNKYIEAYVDISGSMLGTPKALTALLSGEMRDTVQLNALAVYGLEKFFARHERAEMLQSMPGIASMLPKGGNALWGNFNGAPDDPTGDGLEDSYGNFIRFTETVSSCSESNLTMDGAMEYLYNHSPTWFGDRVKSHYSYGLAKTRKEVEANENDPRTWSNPLEAALPNAPDLKVYCLYGVGKPTERGYYYKDVSLEPNTPLNVSIDYDNKDSVFMSEGDGTVSLITHTMCHRWQDEGSKFNPGGSQIKVVEMTHHPDKFDVRGGAETADHVDILGRTELNELLGKIAAGRGDEIEPRIESNILDWVYNIDLGTN